MYLNRREKFDYDAKQVWLLLQAGAKTSTIITKYRPKWNCRERRVYRCIARIKKIQEEKTRLRQRALEIIRNKEILTNKESEKELLQIVRKNVLKVGEILEALNLLLLAPRNRTFFPPPPVEKKCFLTTLNFIKRYESMGN